VKTQPLIIFFLMAITMAFGPTGCGEDSSDAAPSGGGTGNTSSPQAFIAAMCADFSTCCGAAGLPADGAQCRAFYGAFVPTTGYAPMAAAACLSELKADTSGKCSGDFMRAPSCKKVFYAGGTKAPGDLCQDDNDCAPSPLGQVRCDSHFVNGASIQKCQVQIRGQAGSTPCLGTVDGNLTSSSGLPDTTPSTGYLCHVNDGLKCDGPSASCKAMTPIGGACTSNYYDCVTSAYCDLAEHKCKALVPLMGTCQSDEECVEGAYCNTSGNVCASARAVGQACASDSECASKDCTNLMCKAVNSLTLALLCGSK